MTLFIVTVKLKHLDEHDPKIKLTGICRLRKTQCSDRTGEHHSFLHIEDGYGLDCSYVHRKLEQEGYHVTRVEVA